MIYYQFHNTIRDKSSRNSIHQNIEINKKLNSSHVHLYLIKTSKNNEYF
jgi:hypothetical protein